MHLFLDSPHLHLTYLQLPAIFDPATCLRRGHCEVGETRLRQPHDIYYGTVDMFKAIDARASADCKNI